MKQPNFVVIMTDTQNRSMLGAYGGRETDTPNLDRLARAGVRFDRAYDACPLCTPARGAIFSGTYPQTNGAWTNNTAPSSAIPLMGTIFSHYGYRVGHTGKWHLDGSSYFGDGRAGGGFPQDWWYDGKCYADDIGDDMFQRYVAARTADDLRRGGFTEKNIWGHRVADRAIDFLEQATGDRGTPGGAWAHDAADRPFLLVVSFDEPHRPGVAPPEYWDKYPPERIPRPANYNAPVDGKPELQRIHRSQEGEVPWERTAEALVPLFGCNSFIDREIGRVVDAAERLDPENTVIIYTSDHGDLMGAHGLTTKGAMMYDDICRVPLIVKAPKRVAGAPDGAAGESPGGHASSALVSHVDIIPTMLDMAGAAVPGMLHGRSMLPALRKPQAEAGGADAEAAAGTDHAHAVRRHAFISFHRFAVNHDKYGGFYPIRCVTDGRHKLAVNLFDTDELYDLESDPLELANRIEDPALHGVRDELHDRLLEEMDRTRDPFRSFEWGRRPWRTVRDKFYEGGENRPRPTVFFFQDDCIEPRGTLSGRAPRNADQ